MTIAFFVQCSLMIAGLPTIWIGGDSAGLLPNTMFVPQTSTLPLLERRDRSVFPECRKENITFANGIQVSSVHVGIKQNGQDCRLSVNFSRCMDPDNEVKGHIESISEIEITFEIDNIYGSDVIVRVIDCDDCGERFYLPDMKQTEYRRITKNYTGPIIDDLSNDYGCDFGSPVIDYKICIHSQGSNDCFETPCGNGNIFTSFCNQSHQSGQGIGLEVNGVEHDTVVCIFCSRMDCRGIFSNVMLFNIGIIVVCNDCNENAECIEGQCVCKENYTGNGTFCEQVAAQCEMCAYFAECIEGQCLCKKNYTGDGKFQCVQQEPPDSTVADTTPAVPSLEILTRSIHTTVYTSHITTMATSPKDNHQNNVIVGVSIATVTLVSIFIIIGIGVWIYCQQKKKGVKNKKCHVYEDVDVVHDAVAENTVFDRNPAYANPGKMRLEENPAYVSANKPY